MALPTFGVTGAAVSVKPAPTGYCEWRSEAAMPRLGSRTRTRIEKRMEEVMRKLPNRAALNASPADKELEKDLGQRLRIIPGCQFMVKGNTVPLKYREAIIAPNGTKMIVDMDGNCWDAAECDLLERGPPVFAEPDKSKLAVWGQSGARVGTQYPDLVDRPRNVSASQVSKRMPGMDH